MALALRLVLFVLPLGLDTFALSTVLGVTPLPRHTRLRLALTFAAAEGLMPAVGLVLGLPLGNAMGQWSGYVAGVLIVGVGAWMWIHERAEDDDDSNHDEGGGEQAKIMAAARAKGFGVLLLALSISLDELAVGFAFGVLGFPLVPALALIAGQALVLSLVGQWVGRRAGDRLGEAAERLAGPALCAVGIYFIAAQLVGLPL
ncbi:MAG TPA: manganese efflux pump [Ktedonobacterales bacterium]